MIILCCLSEKADLIPFEELQLYGNLDNGSDKCMDADGWLFQAEFALHSLAVDHRASNTVEHAYEGTPCSISTEETYVLLAFDVDMHPIAEKKLKYWLDSQFGGLSYSASLISIGPLLDIARHIVNRHTDEYKERITKPLRELSVQWKLQWLKSHYLSLVVDGTIDDRSPDKLGQWVCLCFTSNDKPFWNGRYFACEFDAVDCCIDDIRNIQQGPSVHLAVQIGTSLSFKLKSFELPVYFNDL